MFRATYLQTGHDPGILHTLDGLARHHTSEVRVVTCAFPVTTARRQASQRAYDRTKGDMNALLSKFIAHGIGTIVS